MSRASRSRAKIKRQKERAALKAAKIQRFKEFKEKGIVSGSKRARNNIRNQNKGKATKHPIVPCGNSGCMSCYGVNFSPFVNRKLEAKNMPQWMYIKWTNVLDDYPNHHRSIV